MNNEILIEDWIDKVILSPSLSSECSKDITDLIFGSGRYHRDPELFLISRDEQGVTYDVTGFSSRIKEIVCTYKDSWLNKIRDDDKRVTWIKPGTHFISLMTNSLVTEGVKCKYNKTEFSVLLYK
jgi:hypothetical protein